MFRATCGLFVLGVLAAQNCLADDAGNAVSESVSNVVTINDVAKVVVALCDGTFGYTTGTSLIVDGGMHIQRLW